MNIRGLLKGYFGNSMDERYHIYTKIVDTIKRVRNQQDVFEIYRDIASFRDTNQTREEAMEMTKELMDVLVGVTKTKHIDAPIHPLDTHVVKESKMDILNKFDLFLIGEEDIQEDCGKKHMEEEEEEEE